MSPAYARLLEQIRRARRLLLWRDAERAGLAALVGLVALGALALLVALLAPLHRAEYVALRIGLLAASAALFALAGARIFLSRSGLNEAALEAGRLGGRNDDDLLAALELGREIDAERAAGGASDKRYSPELREAAVQAAARRAVSLPLKQLRVWPGRRSWAVAAGVALLAFGAIGALGGSKTPRVLRHVVDPSSAPLLPVDLRVEPGNVEVEGGASVSIRVSVAGTGQAPTLKMREESPPAARAWRAETLAPSEEDGDGRRGRRVYSAVIANVKEDLAYVVGVAGHESPIYRIAVSDLPRATGYRVRYEYPAYTGLPAEESQAITGDLAAPRGTKAEVTVLLNRTVRSASMSWEGSASSGAGEPAERAAHFSIRIRSDGRYRIHLADARGRRADLGPFEAHAIADRPPTVTILAPGPEEDLPRDLMVTLLAGATDDYGVKKVLLRYRVREEPERVETLHEERGAARELAVRYTWPVQALNLLPGEEIEYAVGAVDGNAVDGPQTAWSDRRRLRFPSAAEILASVEQQHDETIATLEEALKGARELKQRSEELARDMTRTHEVPWEKRQEIQKTLEGQQAMREQIDKAAEKLSQDAEKLAESRSLNAELVQKLNELRQILSQLRDQSILQAMRKLQEALQKMSPQDLERALQSFKVSQEDVLKKLERTIELLKQIQTEERLEAASERAAEMERRQLALNDSLARLPDPKQMKELAPDERGIQKLGEEQRAALDSLSRAMRPMDPQAAREAEEQRDALGPEGTEPLFNMATESLGQCDGGEAQPSTRKLAQKLSESRKAVDKMREEFQKRRKGKLSKEMEAVARGLLEVSGEQEQMLSDETSDTSERAERQQGLEESTEAAVDRVTKLGNLTLFVSPDIAGALGRAMESQRSAVGRYSMQDVLGGLVLSKEATLSINQAAAALLRAKESMSSSSSSTGFKEAMESLQNLAGQQQGLNDQGISLQQSLGPDGRLSPEQQNAMGRMAAEQEAIRKGLEEAMGKMGSKPGTLGRLDQVGEEMKKVEQELRSGKLEQQTLDRQQRILSRLLDAPRAVEKRDYSRRRTSRPGVDVVRASPGALSPELLKSRPSLAALLARGGRDPVAPRYREMVDEYFQALLAGKAR